MKDTMRRVEVELARSRAVLLSTHAHLSETIAARVGDRLPTARLVQLYCRALRLPDFDEVWLRIHAVAHAGSGGPVWQDTVHDGAAVRRIWRSLLEEIRISLAPHGDEALQERLAYEFAAARAVVMKVHVRNATRLAAALSPAVSGPAAVAQYIRHMDLPDDMRGAVYAFAVARLHAARYAAMLSPPPGGVAVANPADSDEIVRSAPPPADYNTMVDMLDTRSLFSTSVTPAATRAACSASVRSDHDRTVPVSVTVPPDTDTSM
jgi:hypothetical protein